MSTQVVGVIILLLSISWQIWRVLFTNSVIMSHTLKEWQVKGSHRLINGRKIFYVYDVGKGGAGSVICLHGFPTSSYDWIKVLPELKKQFNHILLLDFLGFGFSDKPINHTYTIFEQADLVESLVSSVNIKSAHILAHDYGDTVALELLARYNDHILTFDIQSLTMLNGGVFQDTHKPRFVQKLLLLPVVGVLTSQLVNYPMFSLGFGEVFGKNKPSTEDYQDFWALMCYKDGHKASYKVINFLRERESFKTRWIDALKRTQIKVLFIYGPADPVNPPEFVSVFKKTVPDQTIVTLTSEVGHYPQWEAPDDVIQTYMSFLKPLLLFVIDS